MRLIVCIKQVPEVAEIKFNPQTNTIVREGVPNVVNPFDRRALAEAIRLGDLSGGGVVFSTRGHRKVREAFIDVSARVQIERFTWLIPRLRARIRSRPRALLRWLSNVSRTTSFCVA